MKQLISLFIFSALTNTAFAHPGSNKLVCKSAKNSGSQQKIEISLRRSNGNGWFAPEIEMSVGSNKFQLTTPDENNNYGVTLHNSPLKVISVTAEVPFEKDGNTGYFTVLAIPETVKAFDGENHPVKWSLKTEKEECNDSFGKAIFQGILHGFFRANNSEISIDTQIMDCELTYNPGMAC